MSSKKNIVLLVAATMALALGSSACAFLVRDGDFGTLTINPPFTEGCVGICTIDSPDGGPMPEADETCPY